MLISYSLISVADINLLYLINFAPSPSAGQALKAAYCDLKGAVSIMAEEFYLHSAIQQF